MAFQLVQGFLAVACPHGTVAVALQSQDRQDPNRVFVLDHEDCFRAAQVPGVRLAIVDSGRSSTAGR